MKLKDQKLKKDYLSFSKVGWLGGLFSQVGSDLFILKENVPYGSRQG
jgi:hypothetical protein